MVRGLAASSMVISLLLVLSAQGSPAQANTGTQIPEHSTTRDPSPPVTAVRQPRQKPHIPASFGSRANVTCTDVFTRFSAYDNPQIQLDVNLLIDNMYTDPDSLIHTVFEASDLNSYLHSLDEDYDNEWGLPWTDLQLNYNYFHGKPEGSFFTPATPESFLVFESLSGYPASDTHHADVYLIHPSRGVNNTTPSPLTDPEEDGDPAACDESTIGTKNSTSSGGGYKGTRYPGSYYTTTVEVDPAWSTPGFSASIRLNHELQHMITASRQGALSNPMNEMFSMGAEYLLGSNPGLDALPANENVHVDISLMPANQATQGLAYSHQLLWMTYLLQRFQGDSTTITDDMVYRWIRTPAPSLGSLASVLGDPLFDGYSLGFPGLERVRSVFREFKVAQFVNQPNPTFHDGRYGFSRGVVPWRRPGIFNPYNDYCHKNSLIHSPRAYELGLTSIENPATQVGTYCVTDSFNGFPNVDCTVDAGTTVRGDTTSCDGTFVRMWSADYFTIESAVDLESGTPYVLHFKVWWNPSKTAPSKTVFPMLNAATYPLHSDSLWAHGAHVNAIVEGSTDGARGYGEIWVPAFGRDAKSVTIILSLAAGQDGAAGDTLHYAYSMEVLPGTVSEASAVSLEVVRAAGGNVDSLGWVTAGGSLPQGAYIERTIGALNSFAVIDSVGTGVSTYVAAAPPNDSLRFYRVRARGGSSVSNTASVGGTLYQSRNLGGEVYLSGDVTVGVGSTLTVEPGSVVRVRPLYDSQGMGDKRRTELTIQGVLTSVGTSADSIAWRSSSAFPSPGDWRGIRIIRTPAAPNDSSSQFRYSNIDHAYHAVECTGVGVRIDNSAIRHSRAYGVFANGANPKIRNCVLEQNHAAEVAAYGGAAPVIRGSHLHHSPRLSPGPIDDGVFFLNGGAGKIYSSRISGSGSAVTCIGATSQPILRGNAPEAEFGRNDIVNFKKFGIRAINGATPDCGEKFTGYYGYNNIFTSDSSSVDSVIYVENQGPVPIRVYFNYWNISPGKVTERNDLFVGLIAGRDSSSYNLSDFVTAAGPSFVYQGWSPTAALRRDSGLTSALALEGRDDLAAAEIEFSDILAADVDETDAAFAVGALARIGIATRSASALGRIESAHRGSKYESVRLLCRLVLPRLLMSVGRVSEADRHYEELLKELPPVQRAATLLERAWDEARMLVDVDAVRRTAEVIRASVTDEGLLRHCEASLSEYVGEGFFGDRRAGVVEVKQSSPTGPVTLERSRPNPMNPMTAIHYSVPMTTQATLRVFDVRGRLIRTLIDGTLPAGGGTSRWDGKDQHGVGVPSGVYFYRLDAAGKRLTQKLTVLR